MTDHFTEAVACHDGAQKNIKEFAYHAACVSGERTAELAKACGRSVDWVENQRRAYRLYYRNCESVLTRKLWDELNIEMFVTAAKHEKQYTEAELIDKLAEAWEHGYTVEQFRAVLSVGNKPEWTVRLQRVVKNVWKLYTDYKPEIPPAKRDKFEKAVNQFFDAVKELAEAE